MNISSLESYARTDQRKRQCSKVKLPRKRCKQQQAFAGDGHVQPPAKDAAHAAVTHPCIWTCASQRSPWHSCPAFDRKRLLHARNNAFWRQIYTCPEAQSRKSLVTEQSGCDCCAASHDAAACIWRPRLPHVCASCIAEAAQYVVEYDGLSG
jgi:hypothetical protein